MTNTSRQYVYSVKSPSRSDRKRKNLYSKSIRGVRFDYDGNAVRKTYEVNPLIKKETKVKEKQDSKTNVFKLQISGLVLVGLLFVFIPMVIISGNDKIVNNRIAELNSKISAQQIENKNNMKIYDNKISLSNIQQKGADMGFVQADKTEKLTPSEFMSE